MKKVESPSERYIRLLRKRHHVITSSAQKSKEFLEKIGLDVENATPTKLQELLEYKV